MFNNNDFSEAFQELKLLNEEKFATDEKGVEELIDFKEIDKEAPEIIEIIDPTTETEEDLKIDYIGDVILDCIICHNKEFKKADEVEINEEDTLANIGEPCPCCQSMDGYKIIGEVAKYNPKEIHEVETDTDKITVEVEEKEDIKEKEDLVERLKRRTKMRKLQEARKVTLNNKRLTESTKRDDIDADADDKKERARKRFARMKDDADSDRDYKLKKSDLTEKKSVEDKLDDDVYEGLAKLGFQPFAASDVVGYRVFVKKDDEAGLKRLERAKKLLNKLNVKSKQKEDTLRNKISLTAILEEGTSTRQLRHGRKSRKPLKEEDMGIEIKDLQRDVDYDMEVNHRIPRTLNRRIRKDGLQLIKDRYGEDEVSVGSYKAESRMRRARKPLKEDKDDMPRYIINAFGKTGEDIEQETSNDIEDAVKKYKDIHFEIYKELIDCSGDKEVILKSEGTLPESKRLEEDTEKVKDGKWVNRGKEGTHGTFRTKKEADAQRKAMFANGFKESFDKVDITTDEETITIKSEPRKDKKDEMEETIKPITPETEEKFKKESEDNIEEVSVDDFDEETFDELEESYLKKEYDNVKSYKTEKMNYDKDGKIIVEGIITFKSDKTCKTRFIFEGKSISKDGKIKLIGENKQFSGKKNAFTLTCKNENKKLFTESLNYNYLGKDAKTNKSKRIYGTIKK